MSTTLTGVVSPKGGTTPPSEATTVRRRHIRVTGAWIYLAPLLIALGVWIYGPMVFTAILSFMDWDLTGPGSGFIGFDNYARLFSEPEFLRAIWQTALYAVVLLPFSTVVPMALAIMLWRRPGRASVIYRCLLFLPMILAPVATAVSWQFLLNPLVGLVNEVLSWFHIPPVNWLGSNSTALIVISLITSAKVIAINILLFEASLSAINRRTIEAASIEGATQWEITRFIVVPQLKRMTLVLGLLSIILAGQWTFNNISVLTQGGPQNTTDNVYYRMYTLGFEFFETGMASAAAIVVVLAFAIGAIAVKVVQGIRRGR